MRTCRIATALAVAIAVAGCSPTKEGDPVSLFSREELAK